MAAHWPHEPDENSIAAHLNATTRRRRTDWKAASRQWPAFEARLRQLGYRPRAIAHAFRILSGPETVAEALERADH